MGQFFILRSRVQGVQQFLYQLCLKTNKQTKQKYYNQNAQIDLFRTPVNKSTNSRLGLTEIVHPCEPRPHLFMFAHWSVMRERSLGTRLGILYQLQW